MRPNILLPSSRKQKKTQETQKVQRKCRLIWMEHYASKYETEHIVLFIYSANTDMDVIWEYATVLDITGTKSVRRSDKNGLGFVSFFFFNSFLCSSFLQEKSHIKIRKRKIDLLLVTTPCNIEMKTIFCFELIYAWC